MNDFLLHQLHKLVGLESAHLDPRYHQIFADSFPALDGVTSKRLCKRGRIQRIYPNLLVHDAIDTSDRICLLLDGSIVIERPGMRDVELQAGVMWNHLTWAPRGRQAAGCRLYAGKTGATVVEWNAKSLGRLIQGNPELYKVLTDGVMRCVGVNHDLTLEKARFMPPVSLRRSATLSELTASRRPIYVADNDDEFTVVGYATDIVAAHRQVSASHPGTNFDARERTKGFYFARAHSEQRAVS